MDIDNKDDIKTDDKFETNFQGKNFDDLSFFRLGSERREFWPYDVASTEFKLPALTLTEWGLKNNEIIFEITQRNWLDPYSTYFSLYVQNNGEDPIQLDNSIHSLFSSIIVNVNGVDVEKMNDYPVLSKLLFDMTLTRKDRKNRRINEGFGDNEDGTNEVKIQSSYGLYFKKENDNKKTVFDNIRNDTRKERTPRGTLFKIPFLSRYFGQRIEEKNWKLIPMRNMKITIKITTNPYAFFKVFGKSDIVNEKIPSARPIDRIKIVQPLFCFNEYTFSADYDKILYNKFERYGMFYDYFDYEIFDRHAINNETAELSLKFFVKSKIEGLRALMFFVQDSTYMNSAYARPLARLNM